MHPELNSRSRIQLQISEIQFEVSLIEISRIEFRICTFQQLCAQQFDIALIQLEISRNLYLLYGIYINTMVYQKIVNIAPWLHLMYISRIELEISLIELEISRIEFLLSVIEFDLELNSGYVTYLELCAQQFVHRTKSRLNSKTAFHMTVPREMFIVQ